MDLYSFDTSDIETMVDEAFVLTEALCEDFTRRRQKQVRESSYRWREPLLPWRSLSEADGSITIDAVWISVCVRTQRFYAMSCTL